MRCLCSFTWRWISPVIWGIRTCAKLGDSWSPLASSRSWGLRESSTIFDWCRCKCTYSSFTKIKHEIELPASDLTVFAESVDLFVSGFELSCDLCNLSPVKHLFRSWFYLLRSKASHPVGNLRASRASVNIFYSKLTDVVHLCNSCLIRLYLLFRRRVSLWFRGLKPWSHASNGSLKLQLLAFKWWEKIMCACLQKIWCLVPVKVSATQTLNGPQLPIEE